MSLVDLKIEKRMDLVRDIISLGRNAREEASIKVRQPIREVILDGKKEEIISDFIDLIKEELNVKSVSFEKDLSTYMNYEVKPNFKVAGKIFGKNIKLFAEALTNLTNEEIVKLQEEQPIHLMIDGKEEEITLEMCDIRVSSKEGFNATMGNNNFIILNTTLTKELINEGIVRELISKVQNIRKTKDFDITDRINLYYSENQEFEDAISAYIDTIKEETLAVELIKKEGLIESYNLNGIEVYLDVERR